MESDFRIGCPRDTAASMTIAGCPQLSFLLFIVDRLLYPMKTKQFSTYLPFELYQELQDIAQQRHKKVNDIIREFIRDGLEQLKRRATTPADT